MKDFGSLSIVGAQRDADLLRAYRRLCAQSPVIRFDEIFSRVAQAPASRFWVSEGRAAVVISALIAGRPVGKMRPNKTEMFQEILRRFNALRQARPHLSFRKALSIVIHQPAPRFYLTPRTVGEIIYRLRRQNIAASRP